MSEGLTFSAWQKELLTLIENLEPDARTVTFRTMSNKQMELFDQEMKKQAKPSSVFLDKIETVGVVKEEGQYFVKE